ncbi:MAG: hypothetical protein SOW66_08080 [Porphyromonas sp.]|nr:hypothetical protein [Porphyromonas sp.]
MQRLSSILLVLCAVLLLVVGRLSAQRVVWQAELGHEGVLPTAWTGDRADYSVVDGAIALTARTARTTSLIHTPVSLAEDCSWQGLLRLERHPTDYNYTCLLLARLEGEAHRLRYLALCFTAGVHNLSLREISLEAIPEGYRHDRARDHILLEHSVLATELAQGLHYRVRRSARGDLLLYLSGREAGMLDLVAQTEYPTSLPSQSALGIYSAYTQQYRQGVYLSELSLMHGAPAEEGERQPETEEPSAPSATPSTDFLLSEVMANPLSGSVEYLELYHCGDISTSLEQYSIGLGIDTLSIKRYSMSRISQLLSPGEYYVLTRSPEQVLSAYPAADASKIIQANLPQLRNAGFVLQLYRGKTLVDQLVYDSASWPKGLRSRRGVSLERVGLGPMPSEWVPARKEQGYATPTAPNSQATGGSFAEQSLGDETERLHQIIKRLEAEEGSKAFVRLYSLDGALVASLGEGECLGWLKALQANPRQELQSLVPRATVAILAVYLRNKEGHQEVYDLKFLLH